MPNGRRQVPNGIALWTFESVTDKKGAACLWSPLFYTRPHICSLLASPPAPLQGERGVICKATTKLNNTICRATTRGNNKRCKAITRTNKHNNHAPTRGNNKGCKAIARTNKHSNYAPTRHFTPLSPWRGVGGEAGRSCGCDFLVYSLKILCTQNSIFSEP